MNTVISLLILLLYFTNGIYHDPVKVDIYSKLSGKWITTSGVGYINSPSYSLRTNIIKIDSNIFHRIEGLGDEIWFSEEFECYTYDNKLYLYTLLDGEKLKEEEVNPFLEWGVLMKIDIQNDTLKVFWNVNKPTVYYRMKAESIPIDQYGQNLINKKFHLRGLTCLDPISIRHCTHIHFISETHIKYDYTIEGTYPDTLKNYLKYYEYFVQYELSKDTLVYKDPVSKSKIRIPIIQYPGAFQNFLFLKDSKLIE